MNLLIEQLGGYEQAKRVRDVPAASCFRVRGVEFTRAELERAMLLYRRENGIYEVGDKIQYNLSSGSDPDIFEIYDISDGSVHFEREDGNTTHFSSVSEDMLDSIKHAEDEANERT